MGNKDKSLKRRYKKKRNFYDNRYTKIYKTTTSTPMPIVIKEVPPPSTSSSSDLPSTSLSAKKLKLIANNSDASSVNEGSINSIKVYDVETVPVVNDVNVSDDNVADNSVDSNVDECNNDDNNLFDRSSFYAGRDSSNYLLLDSDILGSIIDLIGKYPTEGCSGHIKYCNDFSNKQGLSCKLEFSCIDCSWSSAFFTSKKVSKNSAGKNPFDVNLHAIIALRENGKGYAGLESLCG